MTARGSTLGAAPTARDPLLERSIKDAFARYDTTAAGEIDASELGHLLQDLAGDSRRISKNDVLFAMNEIEATHDGKIGAAEFRRWYLRKTIGHAGGKFNRLLVKDLVGKTRVPSVDLPDGSFTYGKTMKADEYNAGQVIGGWVAAAPNPEVEAAKARRKVAVPAEKLAQPFGHHNRPSTPIEKVMKGEFGTMDEREKAYPIEDVDVPKVVKRPPVRATKASAGMAARAAEAAVATETKPWKMKKFAHVEPKITVRGSARGEAPRPAAAT